MHERVRLRPAWSDAELARIYARPHDHTQWQDHLARVVLTAQFIRTAAGTIRGDAADLSCGDGAILKAIDVDGARLFGDFAPGHEYTGPVEVTIKQIPAVDLFVCTETLEHLDDPDLVLKAIRSKSRFLALSTPVGAWQDRNPEHYWAFSRRGVEDMLAASGWTVHAYMELDYRPAGGDYAYGCWIAR